MAASPTSSREYRQINRKIYPPRARKKSPSVKEHLRNSLPQGKSSTRMRHYWSTGHEHLGEGRNVNEEQSPFVLPDCSLMFGYFQYWKAKQRVADLEQRQASYNQQENYKTKQARDILQRLRVDVEIEAEEAKKHKELDKAIAITDVHPEYFTELSGRVVKEKFSLHKYVENNREVFKTRLLADQELDDCIRIDQKFDEEQKRLNRIKKQYRQFVNSFEEFLSKDYQRSIDMLEEAQKEARLTNTMAEKRDKLREKYGQVRLDVYSWEENWRLVKMCQEFLYQIAPTSWRIKHDWSHRSQSKDSLISTSANNLFARYKKAEDASSLSSLIEMFEQDIEDAGPTEIYFEDPNELIRVFRSMETQNVNALIHLESLASSVMEMTSTVATAEEETKSKVQEIVNTIEELEDSIRKTEARAVSLEEYADKLVQEIFKELLCSRKILCLQIFVEDTYEHCVGPNDSNLDSYSMMKWIEKTYEDLNLELDRLPRDVVRICEKEGMKQEMKALRETQEAVKKFELMNRLLASLKRMMEPPPEKGRQIMWRSTPNIHKVQTERPALEPTEEELEYLTFFTEYCKQDDFTTYRSQFPDDFDLSFSLRKLSEDGEKSISNSDTENDYS